MKLRLLFSLLLPLTVTAQTFHFEDTCTTLIKNISQSPAHWYLEIFNDAGVDTALRWKAHFQDVPAEWNINFSTQTATWDTVHDGDSADFPLEVTTEFPQKLIIGAMLNDTPGHGTVFFDVYDPDLPSQVQPICYEFIISPLGIDALQLPDFIRLKGTILEVANGKQTTLEVYATDGRLLLAQTRSDAFSLEGLAPQPVILHLRQPESRAVIRTFTR